MFFLSSFVRGVVLAAGVCFVFAEEAVTGFGGVSYVSHLRVVKF